MDNGVTPLGESVIDSIPFWFRVVRVFGGSICFFQVQRLDRGASRGSFQISSASGKLPDWMNWLETRSSR